MRYLWPLLLLLLTACPSPQQKNPHLTLGNPSAAGSQDPNNYLLIQPQYVVSYNNARGTPNWVSWQLNQSWLGEVDRQNDFRADNSLPFTPVSPEDYTGSGYDRGHLAPSADRTRTPEDNSATFLMTNMVPQRPDLNRGPWEKLERHGRQLVAQGKELYIIAGVTGTQKRLNQRITAPTATWKIIVVLDAPGAPITKNTPVIAVNMPNRKGIKNTNWRSYLTSVDALEIETGYDFLSALPTDLQATLESSVSKP